MFPLACRRLSTQSPQCRLVTFLIDMAKNLTIINSRKEFHSLSQLKKSSDSSPWGRQSHGDGAGAAGPTVLPLREQIGSEVRLQSLKDCPLPRRPTSSRVISGEPSVHRQNGREGQLTFKSQQSSSSLSQSPFIRRRRPVILDKAHPNYSCQLITS